MADSPDSTPVSRRSFIGGILLAGVAPMFIPARLLGQDAPSRTLRIGCIGAGRMGRGDFQQAMSEGTTAGARLVALCDVESNTLEASSKIAEKLHKQLYKAKDAPAFEMSLHRDYRELLARSDIDGVIIATPDHWHGLCAIHAARAGKGIYVEKPLTYTIREGQTLVKAVRENRAVLQVGSQQRSSNYFYRPCWLVRNGRIGKLKEIQLLLPPDKGQVPIHEVPVPSTLDYDTWMGPSPEAPFSMERVYPVAKRPGWLQIQRYCLGMITGWGAHMFDIAHWGMGCDREGGPVEVSATGEFPDRGLFDVHTNFHGEARYANGLIVRSQSVAKVDKDALDDDEARVAGVKFIGEEGWIWCSRSGYKASDPRILQERPKGGIELLTSNSHMGNFLASLRSGQDPVAPVECGHRTNTTCVLHHIAMKLGRPIKWDPVLEQITGDPEATALMHYTYRRGYSLERG